MILVVNYRLNIATPTGATYSVRVYSFPFFTTAKSLPLGFCV